MAKFLCHHARRAFETGLGRRVADVVLKPAVARDAGDVHDRSSATGRHAGSGEFLRADECGTQVCVHDDVVTVIRHVDEAFQHVRPRAIDEDVAGSRFHHGGTRRRRTARSATMPWQPV